MSLFICALNSGSNGNCYYVGSKEEAILVDAGLSCRETEKRMARVGLSFSKIKAVFISHEHSDHISGIETISKKYQLPVYITKATLASSRLKLNENLVLPFEAHQPIQLGKLSIIAFPKQHDASHPHSFSIKNGTTTVGVFTDIGKACNEVIKQFKQCNAVFLEANYDDELLEKGNYPYHLKRRISGDFGHLSNQQALELFTKHKSKQLSHLILSHLSRDNNSPEKVMELFTQRSNSTKIMVASRYEESPVVHIQNSATKGIKRDLTIGASKQLSLF